MLEEESEKAMNRARPCRKRCIKMKAVISSGTCGDRWCCSTGSRDCLAAGVLVPVDWCGACTSGLVWCMCQWISVVHVPVDRCGACDSGLVSCIYQWTGVVHVPVDWCGACDSGLVLCMYQWTGVVDVPVDWCGACTSGLVWCMYQ